MSVSFDCVCPERRKPVLERRWTVWQYKCNHSAFNGYHYTPSDYSTVHCLACGATGRTKAKYVDELPLDREFRMYDDGPHYHLNGEPWSERQNTIHNGGQINQDDIWDNYRGYSASVSPDVEE